LGEETPSESKSSGDDEGEADEDEEEEGELMSSPCSPTLDNLPMPGNLFGKQTGISAGAC
jgi:hypothetical protein